MLKPPGHRHLMLLLVGTTTALVGCGGQPDRPDVPYVPYPDEVPPVVLDTPEDAARSALACVQTELRALAHGGYEQIASACRDRLRTLVAVKTIEQMLARVPQFKGVLGDDQIRGYVDNWEAALAYYAEGLQFSQLRRAGGSRSKAIVIVPASGPEDDALIQVTCVREDDNLWRVARIEFVAKPPATGPASQPSGPPQP